MRRNTSPYTRSVTISKWPFEIITSIFHHLDNSSLQQYALTCRDWKLASRNFLFSKIELRTEEEWDKLLTIILKDKEIAKYTKTLAATDFELISPSFYLVAKLFVNLERFYFQRSDFLYVRFYELLKSGAFSSLKELPTPKDKAQSDIFMKCLEFQKHRISETILNTKRCFDILYDKLDSIPNLEKLHVLNDDENIPKSLLDTIEEITQKNELQKLRYFSIKLLGQLQHFRLSTGLETVQPLPNLTSLQIIKDLAFTEVDDTFMLYLMKKVPNLIKLMIQSDLNPQRTSTVTTASEETTIQFLEHISNLSECDINTIVTDKKRQI